MVIEAKDGYSNKQEYNELFLKKTSLAVEFQ